MDSDKKHKSRESKQRLRWSYELHHRFIDAVNQLGGPTKATPKGLMRVLEIPELTLYQLKSHLQKYRLRISERDIGNKQDAAKSQDQLDIIVTKGEDDEPNKNLHVKEAIEIQLEVQKKLHEQIEKKLQIRIEAQGKYLQSVLMKAHETLSGYISYYNLYGVASMTSRSCLSSEDDEAEEEYDFLGHKKPENRGIEPMRSSVDSSLGSSESSEAKQEFESQSFMRRSNELQLMEIKPEEVMEQKKRRWDDVVCVEQSTRKRAFGGHDDEDMALSSFKFIETCSKSKSKSKSNK